MPDIHKLSRAAHDRLTEELSDLTTRGRIDIARKIEAARELGDLSENGDYHAAKEEKGKMEGRIMHLTRILDNSVILESDDSAESSEVGLGSIVEIRFEGDPEDETERYLVGSIEEQSSEVNVVSPGSPMGEALLGATAGTEVEFQSPVGMLKVTVVSIG